MKRIGSPLMVVVLITSALWIMVSMTGCVGTKRSEIRQQERVEQRTQDRYERRRGDD